MLNLTEKNRVYSVSEPSGGGAESEKRKNYVDGDYLRRGIVYVVCIQLSRVCGGECCEFNSLSDFNLHADSDGSRTFTPGSAQRFSAFVLAVP